MSNLWNEAKIVDLLGRSNLAVERAIVAIYNRQTADEKSYQITKHLNNIGFSVLRMLRLVLTWRSGFFPGST